MISDILHDYEAEDWTFMNIRNEIFKARFPWFVVSFSDDSNFPWAVRTDIERLFQLCISFRSIDDCSGYIKTELNTNINTVHRRLISEFCYQINLIDESLDDLIDSIKGIQLIQFIISVLERSLLWNDPDPSWPSDFYSILFFANDTVRRNEKIPNDNIDKLEMIGTEYVSEKGYSHVFYKLESVCFHLQKGQLYDDMNTLAKQTHVVLIDSIRIFHEYKYSSLSENDFEKYIDSRIVQETEWCKHKLTSLIT